VLPGCGVAVPARRDLLDMFTLQDKWNVQNNTWDFCDWPL